MAELFEWHKQRVHRDNRFEALVEKCCSTKNSADKNVMFSTVKELMVFAALVGFQLGEFEPLKSKANCISISMETYATTKHDAYIYLLALAEKPTLDILKDENLRETISIFEGYCNAGLKHIDNWIIDNIGEPLLEDILFEQTLKFLSDNE